MHRPSTPSTKIQQDADVVVVGAGVIGASVAYHLAKLGCSNVVVLEPQSALGLGNTGRATGGTRAQFGSAINIRLSLLSQEKLRGFAEETGRDPGYWPVGYLFMAQTAAGLAQLREALALQHQQGLHSARELSLEEIYAHNPALAPGGIAGGVFCASDGFVRPTEVMHGYLEAAQRLGVQLHIGVGAVHPVLEAGRVVGVETARLALRSPWVVNAAGAWAAQWQEPLGLPLPVYPERRQVAITEACDVLPADMPMTIFLEDGFHLRVRDGRVLLLWPQAAPPTTVTSSDPFACYVDAEWLERIWLLAQQRLPALASCRLDRAAAWAGLYAMSPDHHPLLGASELGGLFLINGTSGHGVMHAPALGQLAAEMLHYGQARSLDVSALDPGRFAAGKANPAASLL